MQKKESSGNENKRGTAGESNVRSLGVNQMHVRTGSSKLNSQATASKKSADMSKGAASSSIDIADVERVAGADHKKAPSAAASATSGVKKLPSQPSASRARQEQITDGRNALQQIQSQEKKAGDRQSVPNIDDTLTVQLESEMPVVQDDELISKQLDSVVINSDVEDQQKAAEERLVDTTRTQRRNEHLDASKEVRGLLEFLYLDVKVRSPAEIQDLTDSKLLQERIDLATIPTTQLIKDIRSSIEILLSIKNEHSNTNNGGAMETLIMNEDSCVDRASICDNIFGSFSHHDTNPFEKAPKGSLLPGREGPGDAAVTDQSGKIVDGNASIKSQSLFSNHAKGLLAGERARTELGSNFQPRRNSFTSEMSMTTQENCKALELQLQKYEGDIRKHISIEHQLQLFAEDLKRSVAQLEKEKEQVETQRDQQLEELRKDKMTLREFLAIKEKTIEENVAKIQALEQQCTESKVQIAQQKQKYDRQLSDLRSKLNLLQISLDTANQKNDKQSLSSEKPKQHFQKLNTDTSNSNAVPTVTGSAKANSRSINSMSRQMSKQKILAATGGNSGMTTSGHRNSSSSQIMLSNSYSKTPVGAQLSTGVTTQSQKHLHQQQMSAGQGTLATKVVHPGAGITKAESQQVILAPQGQQYGMKRQSMGQYNQSSASQALGSNPSNQNIISKVRKTPSDFQLTSFLVVQNNLTQTINQTGGNLANDSSQGASRSRQVAQKQKQATAQAGLSPMKTQRKTAGVNNNANNQALQGVLLQQSNTIHQNSKHSRSSAQLDVAQVSLTSRGVVNESPMTKRGAATGNPSAQITGATNKSGISASNDTSADGCVYKKSLSNKPTGKDIRKNNAALNAGNNTAISVGRRSGTSSMADTQGVNLNNNNSKTVDDEAFSPLPPHSAAESVADMSARRPNSKKKHDYDQYTKNAGTQPQPNRQTNLATTQGSGTGAPKMQTINKSYGVGGTHRRSNTAASFVPTMTLKQFQEQKNAAMASQASRQKVNKTQVNSFDMRTSKDTGSITSGGAAGHEASNVISGRSGAPGMTERQRPQQSSQAQGATKSVGAIKKFEVIRRDKSQPDVLFRSSDKRQMLKAGENSNAQSQLQLAGGSGHGTAAKSNRIQGSKGHGNMRTLNEQVIVQGTGVNGVQGGAGKTATQGRLSSSVIIGPNAASQQHQQNNNTSLGDDQSNQQSPYFLNQQPQQQQRSSAPATGNSIQFMPAPQVSSQEGVQAGSMHHQQQMAKNVASKQQKLLRNQIFKSSDFTNNKSSAPAGFNLVGGPGNATQHFNPSGSQL